MARPLVTLLLVSILACNGTHIVEVQTAAGTLITRADAGGLVLINHSRVRAHYVALEEQYSHLVDLDPDHTKWPSLEPGAERRIPYSELAGYDNGDKRAVVFWWVQSEGVHHVAIELAP